MLNSVLQPDRRMYHRSPCDLLADVDDSENSYSGKVCNLGRGGAYVQMQIDKEPEVGREIIMTIPFKSRANYLMVKARVAWTGKEGMGVTFRNRSSDDSTIPVALE